MDNEIEGKRARLLYDEEARLRRYHENPEALIKLFEPVVQIDVDALGEALVSEHWNKSAVTNDFVVYRRPDQEGIFTEIVLPRDKDVLYAARILVAGARYADFNDMMIVDVLKHWIERYAKTLGNVSAPNLSSYLKEPNYFGSTYDGAKETANTVAATFSAHM